MADAIAAVREVLAVADRGGAVMPAPFGMYPVAALAAGFADEHGGGRDVPLGGW